MQHRVTKASLLLIVPFHPTTYPDDRIDNRERHVYTAIHIAYDAGMRIRVRVQPVISAIDALFEGKDKTLTVPEVAEILSVTKPAVYKWLRNGTIPGYKLGSTWFVLRDELKQTLAAGANSNRIDPTDEAENDDSIDIDQLEED